MRSLLVIVCVAGLALRGRDEDPLSVITACEADVNEVKRLVQEATARAEEATAALEDEENALTSVQDKKAEIALKLDESKAELKTETASLNDLEAAVASFGGALEARRQMLQAQTAEVDEKEALRQAYVEVVAQSSAEVASIAAVDFTGEDGIVAQQRLEVKQAKLAEEKERLKTLEAEVTAALDRIEKQTNLYVADGVRNTAFKAALEDKIAIKAKLTVKVEELIKEAEELSTKVDAAHETSANAKDALKDKKAKLQEAVAKLVQEQGEALDLLKESLEACSVREKKPPSDTEALEVVQSSVGAAVGSSLREFVDALDEAHDGKAVEKPEEPKSEVHDTLEVLKEHLGGQPAPPAPEADVKDTLNALKEHLASAVVVKSEPATAPAAPAAPRKDGMLRALVANH